MWAMLVVWMGAQVRVAEFGPGKHVGRDRLPPFFSILTTSTPPFS